jgi:hypothetical protein
LFLSKSLSRSENSGGVLDYIPVEKLLMLHVTCDICDKCNTCDMCDTSNTIRQFTYVTVTLLRILKFSLSSQFL